MHLATSCQLQHNPYDNMSSCHLVPHTCVTIFIGALSNPIRITCLLQLAGLESKPSKKAALEQIISQSLATCLTRPLAEAAAANNRQALTALAQAWIAYLASMQAKYGADESFLINTAAKLIELLGSLSSRAGSAAPDTGSAPGNDLGPGQGEMPHAQATVLYVIRVAVMEQLSETGQVSMQGTFSGCMSHLLHIAA